MSNLKFSAKKAKAMTKNNGKFNGKRKRLTKRQVARRGATKVVITPRKYRNPVKVLENPSKIQHKDVEFITLAQGAKACPELFIV